MNPITFILSLLLFQAICVAGVALFYARRRVAGSQGTQDNSLRSSAGNDGLYQSDSALDGYAINTDQGVTMDSVFRD